MSTDRLYPIVEKRLGGYIDRDGAVVVAPQYKSVDAFRDGVGRVKGPKGFGYVDATGAEVIAPREGGDLAFFEGFAVRADPATGRFGYVDATDRFVIDARFDWAEPFSEGLARVDENGAGRFIDREGRVVIAEAFDLPDGAERCGFKEGLALVALPDGKYGFLDWRGALAISARPGRAASFREGRAVAGPGDNPDSFTKWGYIDPSGEYVVRPVLYTAGHFDGGLARAYADPKREQVYGYIDRDGRWVWQPAGGFAPEMQDLRP